MTSKRPRDYSSLKPGTTPQQEAAKMGNPEMVRALLDKGADVNAGAKARPDTMKP